MLNITPPFSFLNHSFNILAEENRTENRRLFPRWWPLLVRPPAQEAALHSLPNIFLLQTMACFCERVTSQERRKLTRSLGPTRDMNTHRTCQSVCFFPPITPRGLCVTAFYCQWAQKSHKSNLQVRPSCANNSSFNPSVGPELSHLNSYSCSFPKTLLYL